jgi:putative transposase
MRVIHAQFPEMPGYGSRQMARHLRREGHFVGRKRVRRLMARMGLSAVCQNPRTTVPPGDFRTLDQIENGTNTGSPDAYSTSSTPAG